MFDLADIRALIDAFERSDWDELHFVADGYEVHISTSGDIGFAPAGAAATAAPAVPPAGAADAPGTMPDAVSAATAVAAPAATAVAAPAANGDTPKAAAGAPAADDVAMDGAHVVVSPSPGIFWRAPAPGEPPFVEVGQHVGADSPIGIVEVMKLMNQVLAGVEGTVRAVLVENGVRVDRGEAMVLIEAAS